MKPEQKPGQAEKQPLTKEKLAEMGGRVISHVFGPQRFLPDPAETAHLKAQFANGLDELRQVFYPGTEQLQPGPAPGLYGMPTTGEATIEKTGLDELRGYAKERTAEALQKMQGQQREQGKEMER